MLFNTAEFIGFFIAVVVVYWLIPWRGRPLFLLAASYAFYGFFSVPYLLLMIALTAVNYGIGLLQDRPGPRRRSLLILVLVINLGCLAVYKYVGFVDTWAVRLVHLLGLHNVGLLGVKLILPIGLSFFVFEFIHYQFDLYRGGAATRNPLSFALFPAFFPTQIAGPIKRYQGFIPQVARRMRFGEAPVVEGMELVAIGLFKKVGIADAIVQPVVTAINLNVPSATAADAWAGMMAFYLMIYLDFSAYTDIARGAAMMLGYQVPINFDAPYLATSLQDFWRRWHISLSSWLRDYLYIPLGGSRRGARRTAFNLFVTMSLGGLWHGSSGRFLGWGAGHGLGLLGERHVLPDWWRRGLAGWARTQLTVMILWTLFLATSVRPALQLVAHAFTRGFGHVALPAGAPLKMAGLVVVLLGFQWIQRHPPAAAGRIVSLRGAMQPLTIAVLAVVTAVQASGVFGINHFIYFQF